MLKSASGNATENIIIDVRGQIVTPNPRACYN